MDVISINLLSWHKPLKTKFLLGFNSENDATQIRVISSEKCTMQLELQSGATKWNRTFAWSEDGQYFYYTLQSTDLQHNYVDLQICGYYANGDIYKTETIRDIQIGHSVNATEAGTDAEATAYQQAVASLDERIEALKTTVINELIESKEDEMVQKVLEKIVDGSEVEY